MNLKTIQDKFRQLTARLFEKKYERMLKDTEAQAASNPTDMRIRLKMAETYFKAKEVSKAIRAYMEIADIYAGDNFILKAIAIYKNILKLDPTMVEINLKLAGLYLQLEMPTDAVNQYQIAVQFYESANDRENLLSACKKLVEIDPSPHNRRKLAEIYQGAQMTSEAMEQYKILAQTYKLTRQYDDLLRTYELILPHQGQNTAIIKDMCILYLRRQRAEAAIRLIEKSKLDNEPSFAELYDKAKLMQKALRTAKPA